jgi:hypothetical protein
MIAFAFLLSCFFTSSKTATIFAYLVVFGTGLIGSLLLSRLIADDVWYMGLLELVPSFALFRCGARPPGGGWRGTARPDCPPLAVQGARAPAARAAPKADAAAALAPPRPRARGLFEFGEYAFLAVYRDAFGMSFSTLLDPGNGMIAAWAILAAEWWVFMGLAWYLEQVFASGTGNRRHPLFFLDCLRRVSTRALEGGGGRWG